MAVIFPGTPSPNQTVTDSTTGAVWKWDGTKWIARGGGQVPIQVGFPFNDKPAAGITVTIPMAQAMTVPAALAGTRFYAVTPSTGARTFTVNKIDAGSGLRTALGTVGVTPGNRSNVNLAGAGGTLQVGDALQLVAPDPPDAALADVGITILAQRI